MCPFTGRRAKALFLPWGATRFGCREAYRLVYASQRRGPPDRALAVSRNIRTALGGSPSVLDPFPERPHGMHQKRYDRLRARDEAATRVSMGMIETKLDRMSPGWRERSAAGRG